MKNKIFNGLLCWIIKRTCLDVPTIYMVIQKLKTQITEKEFNFYWNYSQDLLRKGSDRVGKD